MTTNQTIDGVPRELLESLFDPMKYIREPVLREELRALLDAPACKTCCDQGEIFVSKGKVESHMLTEPDPIYRGCPDCKPAAQPQGEPVAWCVDREEPGHLGGYCSAAMKVNGTGFESHTKPLYAEQPAPDIKLHVNVSNVKVTVNADGSYSIDPVVAAQTCCGSCPGGCVYGLNSYHPTYRLAKSYGLIAETGAPAVFHFEKVSP